MGQLVFQATLGGQVALAGPNTASSYTLNLPTVNGNVVSTGDTATVTNTMLATNVYTAPGTIGSGTPNTGAFTTLSASSTVSGTGFSTYLASPPAIGGTAASTGAFTTLTASTSVLSPIHGSASGSLSLQSAGTTAVTIDTSQNVGIGTTSPTFKLDVNGRANISQSSVISYEMLTLNQGYAGSASRLRFINTSGGNCDVEAVAGLASTMAFRTADLERMRIDSTGNFTIGTSSALGKMSLYWNNSTQQGFTLQASTTTFTGSPILFLNSSSSVSGFIGQTATTVSYNTSSDYRLKENVLPMTGALAIVAQLKPVTYKWKADGSDGQGFIAHELQAVVPDCVTGEKDAVNEDGSIKAQGVDTSFLVATLTAAIQEMKAIIDEQSVTINDLKARIETLEIAQPKTTTS